MKNILGLDVGSYAIKASEFQQALRGLEAGQMVLEQRPQSGNQTLPESLKYFSANHPLQAEHIAASVPGTQLSTRKLAFPFRDRKKLSAVIPFEIEGLIPFEIEEVVVDWTLTDDNPKQSGVLATVARRDAVSSLLDGYREAGLEPRVLEAEGLVLGNLTSIFDLPGNRLIIDFGHRKTTMCLVIDGKAVNARTIAVAGLALSEAIAEELGCPLEQAEQIKCSEGVAGPNGHPLRKAVAILDRIVREIVYFLESNQEHLDLTASPSGVDQITMVGGTAKLIGLGDFIERRLGVEARPLEMPSAPETAALLCDGDPVLFAHAIALGIRATSLATTQMNFRQDEFAYRTDLLQIFARDLRPTAILAATAILLGLTSFVTSLVLLSSRTHALETRAMQLYSQVAPDAEIPDNPVPALSRALQDAKKRADFLGLYGNNMSAIDLLTELSRDIPEDLKVQFEEVNINRRIIKIKVLGESYQTADRLKSVLDRSKWFSNAEVARVKTARRGKGKRFNLTLNLEDARPTS